MAATAGASIGPSRFGGGVRISMSVEGFDTIEVGISRFGETIRDWTDFWTDYFAPDFYNRIERNFELEGQLAGGWAPLEERYAAWKATHFPGKTILRRTDRLFRSLTWDGHETGPEGIFRAEPQSLELGTSVPYARAHQLGSTRQRFISAVTLPARPMLFLAAGMRSTFGRLLHKWAFDKMGAAGLGNTASRTDLSASSFL